MPTTIGGLFVQGGWVMWPLLIASILTWAILLERAFVFLTFKPRLQKLTSSLLQLLKKGDQGSAKQVCLTSRPELSEYLGALFEKNKNKESLTHQLDRNRQRLNAYFKRNLWILGTIGSASPFIGLLGTVIGILRAFGDMAEKGVGGFTTVAAGIAEALIATAFGLIVAVIALITYNIFTTLANQTTQQLKLTLEEIVENLDNGSTT